MRTILLNPIIHDQAVKFVEHVDFLAEQPDNLVMSDAGQAPDPERRRRGGEFHHYLEVSKLVLTLVIDFALIVAGSVAMNLIEHYAPKSESLAVASVHVVLDIGVVVAVVILVADETLRRLSNSGWLGEGLAQRVLPISDSTVSPFNILTILRRRRQRKAEELLKQEQLLQSLADAAQATDDPDCETSDEVLPDEDASGSAQ